VQTYLSYSKKGYEASLQVYSSLGGGTLTGQYTCQVLEEKYEQELYPVSVYLFAQGGKYSRHS